MPRPTIAALTSDSKSGPRVSQSARVFRLTYISTSSAHMLEAHRPPWPRLEHGYVQVLRQRWMEPRMKVYIYSVVDDHPGVGDCTCSMTPVGAFVLFECMFSSSRCVTAAILTKSFRHARQARGTLASSIRGADRVPRSREVAVRYRGWSLW